MGTKAKEITSNPHGDRNQCPICNPRKDRIRHDQVWGWKGYYRRVEIDSEGEKEKQHV